tara:strand:+ start:1460 stop:1939 length:480 start_codon:yes stop_codon:yes gene_type:complete
MVKTNFSGSWKRSTQTRKQRKYRYNAPLHIKQKMLHVHLSSDLKKKYGIRNTQVKKNDKVRILRGQFKKKEGKVERINLKKEKVFVTGIELIKKEGTKVPVALSPSNLLIIDLNLDDRKRKNKLEKYDLNKKDSRPEEKNQAEKKTPVNKPVENKEEKK